jgi:molecular chaperone GrpE
MENLRKRHQRELQNAHKFANEKILLDLLPVKDSLDLGVEAASKSLDESQQGVLEGIELIQQMLMQVLGRHQIEEIKPLGEKFNPEFHDAVAMANSDRYPSDIVMDVIQSGYQLNGRVTRPARVVVSRGPINPPTEEEI